MDAKFRQNNSEILFDSTKVCGHFVTLVEFTRAQRMKFGIVYFSFVQYCRSMTGKSRMNEMTGITGMTGGDWGDCN